jgi:hypothetical protein
MLNSLFWIIVEFVGFEVFTVVTMNNAVFWDVTLCRIIINGRFMHWPLVSPSDSLPLLPRFSSVLSVPPYCCQSVSYRLTLFLARVISSTLKMEEARSSETSVYNKPTRRHIPEDGIPYCRTVYVPELCKTFLASSSRVHLDNRQLLGKLTCSSPFMKPKSQFLCSEELVAGPWRSEYKWVQLYLFFYKNVNVELHLAT